MIADRRQTKIICTVGPATGSYDGIQRLYDAGMSVVRLNMSHASQAEATEIIHWVKTLNRKVQYPMPIMLDTQGPEIRTGTMPEPLQLRAGQTVFLDTEPHAEGNAPSIEVNYPELTQAVATGDRVRLDNGLINVRVVSKTPGRLECHVIDGGELGSRKHVNLPGIEVKLASITAKDREDIAFGVDQEIDFIALSFVRSAADIAELRELLGPRASRSIQVIAKIENTEGVRNAEEIARAADGVMVARGDLGIETDIATLPIVQRRLLEICARLGKRCIVATHLMESMIENPIPTRAEVTDVANAVYEGADAIMLSGETSVGAYPYRCVEQLANIAQASERQRGFALHESLANDTAKQHPRDVGRETRRGDPRGRHRGHHAARHHRRPRHKLPPRTRADLRLHKHQPDPSSADAQPGRVRLPHVVQQRSREDDPYGAGRSSRARRHRCDRVGGGHLRRACRDRGGRDPAPQRGRGLTPAVRELSAQTRRGQAIAPKGAPSPVSRRERPCAANSLGRSAPARVAVRGAPWPTSRLPGFSRSIR